MAGQADKSAGRETPGGTVTDENFARNLRTARERAGMSQSQLATQMAEHGWPYYPQTIHRIETGSRKVSVGEAKALAGIFKSSLDVLTWRGPAAEMAARLRADLARAHTAFDQITEWTEELLDAQAALGKELEEAEKAHYYDRSEIHDLAKHGVGERAKEPGDAVRYGRDLHTKKSRPIPLGDRLDQLGTAARGGRKPRPGPQERSG